MMPVNEWDGLDEDERKKLDEMFDIEERTLADAIAELGPEERIKLLKPRGKSIFGERPQTRKTQR